jgi:hypothetical protein
VLLESVSKKINRELLKSPYVEIKIESVVGDALIRGTIV